MVGSQQMEKKNQKIAICPSAKELTVEAEITRQS